MTFAVNKFDLKNSVSINQKSKVLKQFEECTPLMKNKFSIYTIYNGKS